MPHTNQVTSIKSSSSAYTIKILMSGVVYIFLMLHGRADETQNRFINEGIPTQWLVGGIHDGQSGNDIYAMDVDKYIRPNPEQTYLSTEMMGGRIERWQTIKTNKNGHCLIMQSAQHSYGWARGVGYACLYLWSEHPCDIQLHWLQSGIKTIGWLDNEEVAFTSDVHLPAVFEKIKEGDQKTTLLEGVNTEGLKMTALPEKSVGPQVARLKLTAGWHRLLVKMTMQNPQGAPFFFYAQFTNASGEPINDIKISVSDPTADLELQAIAARFRPLVFTDAPANLPRPGNPLKLLIDMDWHPIAEEKTSPPEIKPFSAKLKVQIIDYNGKEIESREVKGTFPSKITLNFNNAPETGYYSVHSTLLTLDDKLITRFYSDGFTVVSRGVGAQKERLEQKKLWLSYYYLLNGSSGEKTETNFAWLERSGVYKNFGSTLCGGWDLQKCSAAFKRAVDKGLILFVDFAADSIPRNNTPNDANKIVEALGSFTRYYKSANEIDIHYGRPDVDSVRDPQHWVARTKWEYEAAHRSRPDALYLGGSLVRPGDMRTDKPGLLGPGEWFVQCLKLGIDKYIDAWDVHAYPQFPPQLKKTLGNSDIEDIRGVIAAYKLVGRENKLPYFYGEIGAKAAHSPTGRKGQADNVAKLIAWANAQDCRGIAFCGAQEYCWGEGRLWDYLMGHQPGEAAMITAGALIDGFPCKVEETGNAPVQAAWFGNTFMIWRTDEKNTEWRMKLPEDEPWVIVNVVGLMRPIETTNGEIVLPISSSPQYLLKKSEYDKLTK